MTQATSETTRKAVEVGDFFVSSWGYDQTNIDFYRVVEVSPSGKTVMVQRWTSKMAEDQPSQPYADYMVPGDAPRKEWVTQRNADGSKNYAVEMLNVDSPPQRKTLRDSGGRAWFKVASYADAQQWSGKPQSQTGFGFGH